LKKLKNLRPTELIAALKRAGFVEKRQTGSHVILLKPGLRSIPVPVHPGTLKKALQESIIKQAGYTAEEFEKFL
jgi:predicted RNA binding protein YcfA (HicA-like mRNA interferase family)